MHVHFNSVMGNKVNDPDYKKRIMFSPDTCESALAVILLALSPRETGSGPHSVTKLLCVHFVHA